VEDRNRPQGLVLGRKKFSMGQVDGLPIFHRPRCMYGRNQLVYVAATAGTGRQANSTSVRDDVKSRSECDCFACYKPAKEIRAGSALFVDGASVCFRWYLGTCGDRRRQGGPVGLCTASQLTAVVREAATFFIQTSHWYLYSSLHVTCE
jgi:hypothetical protein